jgi:cell division protein FtsB
VLARRWLAVAALALVAFLYYRPLVTYLEAREALTARTAEVEVLRADKRALERRLADQESTTALVHEARRLAYVRPGEQLFVVQGIPEWRRARAAAGAKAAKPDDG